MVSPILLLGLLLQGEDDPRLPSLLEELGSEKVAEREQAAQELTRLGPGIARRLRGLLKQERDAEVRGRVELILQSFVARPVCQGSAPLLAPSGDRMVFRRWVQDPELTDLRGNPCWNPETWVWDLARGRERRLVEGASALSWVDGKTLYLSTGAFVDAGTGKPSPERKPVSPGGRKNRTKLSPDGRRQVSAVSGADNLLFVLESGETRTIPLGYPIYEDPEGFLSWSPDGTRLLFDLTFFRRGHVPIYRIGVVELATGKVIYVGERESCHYNWGLRNLEGTGFGEDLWNRQGDRFVFVTGRGHGEAELQIAGADGSGVRALTDDGKCKWCPVFDPAGRRLAYAAATWGGEDGTLSDGHIRILDLWTGEEERLRPPAKGTCGTLAWSPDGSRLYYDWREDGKLLGRSILEAWLPRPLELPPGTAMVTKPLRTGAEEVLLALGSENPSVITWGTERIEEVPRPEAILGLKTALHTCRKLDHGYATREVVSAIGQVGARELAPEVVAALDIAGARPTVIRLLARWKVEAAGEPLEKIVQDAVLEKVHLPEGIRKDDIEYVVAQQLVAGVDAGWALVILGKDAAWNDLGHFARSKHRDVRIEVIDLLRDLRDPRSVDLLIGLVPDTEAHHLYRGGQLGDAAAASLKKLTGEDFGKDASRWSAWWKERAGKLPDRR